MSLRNYAALGLEADGGTAEPAGSDLSERPLVASINLLSVALLEIMRPFLWQSLILLYLWAQFGPR